MMKPSPNPDPGETRAIVFDIYGTLVGITDPFFRRDVPRLFGVSSRQWMLLVRKHLLTTPLPDLDAFAGFICQQLVPDRAAALQRPCMEVIERELSSMRLLDGALSLLRFLRHRGFRLGLLSNLSAAHKLAVVRLGLDELVDVAVYSCDEGRTKPDPELYRSVCRRLEVDPEQTLMVGDSPRNDVQGARAAGLRALLVGNRGGKEAIPEIASLGLLRLTGSAPLEALLAAGNQLHHGPRRGTIHSIAVLPEEEQGRYNLVFKVRLIAAGVPDEPSLAGNWFAKRYLHAESAHVEQLAHRVLAVLGFSACDCFVVDNGEPLLMAAPAPGEKYDGRLDPDIAAELARHMVFAYIFANADMRPRNAFLSYAGGRPTVTMVDLEHCFLNLALDIAGLPDPLEPTAIDQLGDQRLRALVKKSVLTQRTLRRARGEFFAVEDAPAEILASYRKGFLTAYREIQARAEPCLRMIRERVYEEPYLVVGTRSYRRAMAALDVDSIRDRLDEDPEAVLAQVIAPRRSS
jgi:putative hydrolase of the HAD superfamily